MGFDDQYKNIGYFINLNLINIHKATLREEDEGKICRLIFMFIGDNMHHCNQDIQEQLKKEIDDVGDINKDLNIRTILKWQKLKFLLLSDKNIMNYRAEALISPEELLD